MSKSRPSRKTKMTSHRRATQRLHCRTCSPTYPRTTSSSSTSSSSARWSCCSNQQTPRMATAGQRRRSRPSRTSTKLRSKRRKEQRVTVSAPPPCHHVHYANATPQTSDRRRRSSLDGCICSAGRSSLGAMSTRSFPVRFISECQAWGWLVSRALTQ